MKKLKKVIATFVIIFCLGNASAAQTGLYTFEQLDSLQKINKKPVVVFLYTQWCTYCGAMKNVTLKDKNVRKMLDEHFYFVALDIEERKTIFFKGYAFNYEPTGTTTGIHQLAVQLGTINGKMAYPGICFLNADFDIIYQQAGYIAPKAFLAILNKLK